MIIIVILAMIVILIIVVRQIRGQDKPRLGLVRPSDEVGAEDEHEEEREAHQLLARRDLSAQSADLKSALTS